MLFYLGTHETSWLGTLGVPLMVSHRGLSRPMPEGRPRRLPRAIAPWVLDSGGFSELSMFGGWRTTAAEYIDAVHRYRDQIGMLAWCAPQDWMVEPVMLARTGLTVAVHQSRTIDSYLTLTAAGLPVIPVLQGQTVGDYLAHVDAYTAAGVKLDQAATVGLGSVCRRQATDEIATIVGELAPLRLHGFGVKARGFARYRAGLISADSLAWSYDGRRGGPCPVSTRASCANCAHHAVAWRTRLVGP